jgi:hypothetical protein
MRLKVTFDCGQSSATVCVDTPEAVRLVESWALYDAVAPEFRGDPNALARSLAAYAEKTGASACQIPTWAGPGPEVELRITARKGAGLVITDGSSLPNEAALEGPKPEPAPWLERAPRMKAELIGPCGNVVLEREYSNVSYEEAASAMAEECQAEAVPLGEATSGPGEDRRLLFQVTHRDGTSLGLAWVVADEC